MTRPSHVVTAQDARNEYNDVFVDLSTFLEDGDGITLTDYQKEWLTRWAECVDEAVTNWVELLGGKP